MSKYTMTIKEYCEGKLLAQNHDSIDNMTEYLNNVSKSDIMAAGRTLFPQYFPFYSDSEALKLDFEDKFIQHFYFYEIGQETIGQFKWYLEDFLNTRMPYYAELFATKLSDLEDAIKNYDITRTEQEIYEGDEATKGSKTGSNSNQASGTTTSSGTSTSAGTDSNTTKEKQYPLNDSNIQEISREESEGSDSNTTTDNNTTTDSSTSSGTNTESTSGSKEESSERNKTQREYGLFNANKIERTKEFRELIFNINELIFEDARKNHLFFELW